MSTSLQHHGILGMRWGVRRTQAQLDRKDAKWASKHSSKLQEKTKKAVSKDLESYVKKELNPRYNQRLKSGKLSKDYINAYNKKLAELMNNKIGEIKSPSGRVVKFVAKRGDVGVFTALADQGYNMNQIKNGLYESGRVAYKKDTIKKVTGGGS